MMKMTPCFIVIMMLSCNFCHAHSGFEREANAGFGQFVDQTDAFFYFAAGSNGLVEIDLETGEELVYEIATQVNSVYALDKGRLAIPDNNKTLCVTDLLRYNETIELIDDKADGNVMRLLIKDDVVYYATNGGALCAFSLGDHSIKTLIEDHWMRQFMVANEGIWLSDNAGLYLYAYDTGQVKLMIDAPVGFIQRLHDKLYYSESLSGGLYTYDMHSGEIKKIWDGFAYEFIVNEGEETAAIIRRPYYDLVLLDMETSNIREVALDDQLCALNILNGEIYALCYTDRPAGVGGANYTLLKIDQKTGLAQRVYATMVEDAG